MGGGAHKAAGSRRAGDAATAETRPTCQTSIACPSQPGRRGPLLTCRLRNGLEGKPEGCRMVSDGVSPLRDLAFQLLYSLAGFPKTSGSRHVKARVDEDHA